MLSQSDYSLASEILQGLRSAQPHLPSRLFYDQRGSELFEQICQLPEYYLTRTEIALLGHSMPELRTMIGPQVEVLEFGSGSGIKTGILIDGLDRPAALRLVEISPAALAASLQALRQRFPQLEVDGQVGDYTATISWPTLGEEGQRRLVFFPGSTIGNFERSEAVRFLAQLAHQAGPKDLILLGTDMVKDIAILEAAYDDSAGVTAAFNRNILAHCNTLLDGNCDPQAFDHQARWDASGQRITMHLRAKWAIDCELAGETIHFNRGETILTEYSHKYRPEDVSELAENAGWHCIQSWYDPQNWFGLHLFGIRGH